MGMDRGDSADIKGERRDLLGEENGSRTHPTAVPRVRREERHT